MKLERFKEKNNKKKSIITFTICCVLLIVGAFFYQSFALFETRENFNLINGNVSDPGDLYFAYYVDDVLTYDMPSKDSGYTMSSKSNCTNGVTITWDDESWSAFVNYEKYKIANSSRTKCILYFEKKVIPPNPADAVKDYIIAKASEGTIIEDDGTEDHNLRYIGAPWNYVYFNCEDNANPSSTTCELWRIIGVMNNIKKNENDDVGETRIKIRRYESIGSYSWDTSDSAINDGYGVNEWSQADVMKLMNPGYEIESIGGSLYWNRGSGSCYNGRNNATTSCNFTNIGLTDEAKKLIDEAVWYTGGDNAEESFGNLLASRFYELERSNKAEKNCKSSNRGCNDTVERTAKWTGYIGLINPSDFGYATGGGTTTTREECLNTPLVSWGVRISNLKNCYNNNWLYPSTYYWTMNPQNSSTTSAYGAFSFRETNTINITAASIYQVVFPVTFLKSNVTIVSGEETRTSPFILSNA